MQQLASLASSLLSGTTNVAEVGKPMKMRPMMQSAGINLSPFFTGSLGNFPYYYLDPNTLLFNSLTYNWINANLKNNTPPIMQGSGYFTNYFISALSSVSYSLSSADQAALSAATQNVNNQQLSLLLAWKGVFGKIPAPTGGLLPVDIILNTVCTTWASPAVTLAALLSTANPGALLNKIPAGAQSIIVPLGNYINASNSCTSLRNASSMNNGYLQSALAALQSPASANGGLAANDENIYPAYSVLTPLPDIIAALSNSANTIVLNMTISKLANGQVSVSLNGGPGFNANVDDLFSIVLADNTNFFSNLVSTSSAPVQMKMTFTGVTMVNFGPVPFNSTTGQNWYWMTPIINAITNTGNDVTGFVFSPGPGIDFTNAGPFGFLSGVAISNQPSFQIVATGVTTNKIQAAVQESSTAKVSFLNAQLGDPATTYSLNYTHTMSAGQSLDSQNSLTIDSAPTTVATGNLNSLAWVHGVITNYPAS
jgi:hypothetical protein